jgi:hypothetical protein
MAAAMIDAVLLVLVLGVIAIAISVDLAALLGWLKAAMNRWGQP